MELAFVLLFVLLGTGAIVYAGMRPPVSKADADASSADAAPDTMANEGAIEGGGDGGNGGN